MTIVYAQERPPTPSIFLAGPTPRTNATPSWRPEAINFLCTMGFNGTIYVPEMREGAPEVEVEYDYDAQINWEWQCMSAATVVAFWVPRELTTMPAFTTNVEFGLFAASGKCLFGAPPDAPKNKYLITLAKRYNIPVYDDLRLLMMNAANKANNPYDM